MHIENSKNNKVILFSNPSPNVNVLLNNITVLIFAVFDVQLTMSPLTFVKTTVFYIYICCFIIDLGSVLVP